jgi:carboxylesterase type B
MVVTRFFSRRIVLVVVIGFVVSLLLSAAFYTTDVRPSAEWLPKFPYSNPSAPSFTFPPKDPDGIVHLDYISVKPDKTETTKSFWNIPYAASAGGENRFRAPQPPPLYNRNGEVVHWSGKLGMCPVIQKIDAKLRNRKDIAGPDVRGIDAEHTEDCLSLNVFTPHDAEAGDDLPVVVNIPGGGFHLPGRASGKDLVEKSRVEKEGEKLDKGIIVVTMYYRNGIYGFLSGDQIQKDGDFNGGLRDQRATLEWIQKYIRYFGGNPDHVVLMGTSAGGASVLLQLTANGGDNTFPAPGTGQRPLFHGAIAESPASPTFYTRDQANLFWRNVALGLNCTDLTTECVRKASVGDLYYQNYPMSFPERDTPPRWMWAPTAEGPGGLWTEPATAAIISGRYAQVPTIIGFTSNEGSDQVKKGTDNLGEFKSYLKDHYPLLTDGDLDQLARNYPNDRHWPDSGRYWDAVAKAQGDIRYICPTKLASDAMGYHNPSGVKAWQYQWDVVWGPDGENGYGTKHAGTVGQIMARPPNEISDYFISFMKHLDPNVLKSENTPTWTALGVPGPKKRMFATNRANQKEGIKWSMQDPDPERERRCKDIRKMMPRLQQEILPPKESH